MRAIAVSVWIFINLVFFGMCGYIYLLWSQYWHYISKHQQHYEDIKKPDQPLVEYFQDPGPISEHFKPPIYDKDWKQNDKSTQGVIKRKNKPRFTKLRLTDSPSVETNCVTNCDKKSTRLSSFKNQLIVRLRRVLHEESNVFKSRQDNPYSVTYSGAREQIAGSSPQKLVCDLQRALPHVRTVSGQEKPFLNTEFGESIPKRPLFELNEKYNNCAIVSNSGALNGSKLGQLIDSHDLVLRFNHAPTKNYESDVGSKTTIRILNSQVVSKHEFNFLGSEMYKNIKLLAWDPSNYTSSLLQWRQNPDFDVFSPYMMHRKMNPSTNFHLVDPRDLWRLWDFLQARSTSRIRRNPPSSGFLGLALLLPHCSSVNLFEYIPSVRLTKKCHYFDLYEDPSCTFGVWHPLAAEKLLALNFNTAPDRTVFETGYISVPGYDTLKC